MPRSRYTCTGGLALLSLLAAEVLFSAPALGGCLAHYVRDPWAGPSWHGSLERLDRLSASSHPADAPTPTTPAPCTGALCSGNPAPVSTTPTAIPPAAGEWACSVRFDVPGSPEGSHLLPPPHLLRPRHEPGSIFHPPR